MKYVLYVALALAWIYGLTWTFNHLNPWVSIVFLLVTIGAVIEILKRAYRKFKKNLENEK